MILPYKGITPRIHPSAFVAETAVVIGDVEIGAGSNIWFGCVVRGDVNIIRIGENSNVQDGCVVHVSTGGQGTHIGDNVTVGHMALLHDCTVESNSFVGMKACMLDKAKLESGSMLAAGGLLTPGKVVPKGELWAGNPAKHFRPLTDKDLAMIAKSSERYCELANEYHVPRKRIGRTMAQIRKEQPNAYKPWTAEEDRILRELYLSEVTQKDIASRLKRGRGAIWLRLRKMGLVPGS